MRKNIKSFIRIAVMEILIFPLFISAQIIETPLEKCLYKKVTSHDELLLYINNLESQSGNISIENIGLSVQGRAIPMIRILQKNSRPKIKVLIFCQQHGNEPSGKEAALFLLKEMAAGKGPEKYSNIDLYIIPSVNPDGNEAGKRNNANGEDLNRNHLIMSEPEVIAVHNAFERIQPEVTLDVHEYAAYRKEFRDAGYFRTVDEQFGAPTNLNVSDKIMDYSLNKLFPYLEKDLSKKGISFSNYYKMNGPADTVRASTTSIDDGRQSFAIRNTFSLILEGKNGRNMNDELERRTASQLAAVGSFLKFVNANSKKIAELVKTEKNKIAKSTDPIALQMDYICNNSKINLQMNTVTGKDTVVSMNFSPKVKILESADRPEAYAIPASRKNVIKLLDKHRIAYRTLSRKEEYKVEIYSVSQVIGKWMENKPTSYASVSKRTESVFLNPGDVIVPLNDERAMIIAIALEPASMWGLIQYEEFSELRKTGSDYPIYRIPNPKRN